MASAICRLLLAEWRCFPDKSNVLFDRSRAVKFSKRITPGKSSRSESLVYKNGVNFINDLQAAFVHSDPKSAKETDNLTVFFALSRSVHGMFLKLTPGLKL